MSIHQCSVLKQSTVGPVLTCIETGKQYVVYRTTNTHVYIRTELSRTVVLWPTSHTCISRVNGSRIDVNSTMARDCAGLSCLGAVSG